ncbi:MAG: hypothetical protein NVSMB51_09080 [Solirubrobacteraceae bacterium]
MSISSPPKRSLPPLRRAADPLEWTTGNNGAPFAELYRRHHQELYRYCRSILRHEHDAQDALQNTMLKAGRALAGDKRDIELRPWLFRVAHNECISLMRKRRESCELTDYLPAPATTEGRYAIRDEVRQLSDDLLDLPERQRSALVLRELNGLSHDEIAAVLGTTSAIVKSTIFEARSALSQYREGRDLDCGVVRAALSNGDRRVLRGRRHRAHLRNCVACGAFQSDLLARPAQLAALAPPLPAAAGIALLHHLLHGMGAKAAAAANGGCLGTAGLMAPSTGSSALTGVTAKLAASAAAVLAVGGAAAIPSALRAHHPSRSAPSSRGTPVAGSGRRAARSARATSMPRSAISVTGAPGRQDPVSPPSVVAARTAGASAGSGAGSRNDAASGVTSPIRRARHPASEHAQNPRTARGGGRQTSASRARGQLERSRVSTAPAGTAPPRTTPGLTGLRGSVPARTPTGTPSSTSTSATPRQYATLRNSRGPIALSRSIR